MSKLRFKSLLSLSIISLFALSGCGAFNTPSNISSEDVNSSESSSSSNQEQTHVHTYNDFWSRDNENHWHESKCEHNGEKLKKDVEPHNYDVTEVAPTYQSEGTRTYRCKICSYSYSETIASLVHQYSNDWSSDETGHFHACLDKGYESIKKDFAKHDYEVTETPATYDEEGKYTYVCKVCGYTYDKGISKIPHRFAADWSSDETGHYHVCIDEGYGDLTIDLAEHTYSIAETPATYDEEGSKTYTCKVCGFSYSETIDKIRHNYEAKYTNDEEYHWHQCIDDGYTDLFDEKIAHDYEDQVIEPTYDESGYTVHTCKDCGYSYIEQQNNQLEHHFSDQWSKDNFKHWHKCIDDGFEDLKGDSGLHDYQENITEPTFTEYGYSTFVCKDCGFSYIQYGHEYKPHNFSPDWTFDTSNHWHDCTDEGYGELYSDQSWHTYSKWVMDTIPDGTNNGQMHKECSVCGYSTDYVSVPASAGNYNDYLYFSLWTTSEGDQYYSVDGRKYDVSFVYIPDNINGIPVKWIRSYAFDYNNSLQTIYISDSVTDIDYGAFYNCSNLETVVLPNNLTYISNDTFSYCYKLVDINFPSTLGSIGYSAFNSCTSLETIDIKGSPNINGYAFANCTSLKNVSFAGSSYLAYNSFQECTSLEEIHLPSSGSFNESNVFYNCSSLKRVYVSSMTTYVNASMFTNCPLLEEFVIENGNSVYSFEDGMLFYTRQYYSWQQATKYIAFVSRTMTGELTIPDGIVGFYNEGAIRDCQISSINFPSSFTNSIQGNYFLGCTNLSSLSIDEDNSSYASDGCAVYNKDYTSLYAFAPATSGTYFVRSTVTYIGYYAFSYCDNLEHIYFPNGLQAIGSQAFYNCESLKSVTIPSSVTRLDYNVFQGCRSLESIYFLGNSIQEIPSSTFSDCSSLASITFPDSVQTLGGWCFYNCDSLTNINTNKVKNIYDYCFYDCNCLESVGLPNVERIDSYAFYNCPLLTSISINANFKNLDSNYVFAYCSSLSDISSLSNLELIGQSNFLCCYNLSTVDLTNAKSIKSSAFDSCGSLTSIDLPNIENIGHFAFNCCTNLASVTIGNNISFVGCEAFSGCHCLNVTTYGNATYLGNSENPYLVLNQITDNSITSISIAENCKAVSASAFNNCYQLEYNSDNGVYYVGNSTNPYMFLISGNGDLMPTSYTIQDGCQSIAYNAFNSCYDLNVIVIPDSVYSIGDYAFYYCHSLRSFKMPSSLKYIGEYAFYYCNSMTSVYLPNGVSCVDVASFGYCTSLTSFIFASEVPPLIGRDVFYCTWNYSSFVIYIPSNSMEAYSNVNATYWRDKAVSHFRAYSSLDDLISLGVPQLW